jgi:hypothetical protein
MMQRGRRRKCLCCQELFRADARNRRHQRYCCKPACRHASHAASQRRWLSKPENRDYFRGAINGARVQAWRRAHPGYAKRADKHLHSSLQDDSCPQPVDSASDSAGLTLQEIISAQPLVRIGLIAHLTDSALQDDIALTSRRLLKLGQDILGDRVSRTPPAADRPRPRSDDDRLRNIHAHP